MYLKDAKRKKKVIELGGFNRRTLIKGKREREIRWSSGGLG